MSADILFSIVSVWVLPAWILLAFFPAWKHSLFLVLLVAVIPLAVLYAILIFSAWDTMSMESFGSLDAIASGFGDKYMLLAGWIHYLAFDLMVGMVVVRDGLKNKIPLLARLIPLLFVFMLGPVGLLFYLLIRYVFMRNFGLDLTSPVT